MHIVSNFSRLPTSIFTWNIEQRMNEYDDNEEVEEEEENDTTNPTIIEDKKDEDDFVNALKNSLKIPVNDTPLDLGPTPYKVAIVGMNELGSATAFLLICRQVVTDVIIIDRNTERLAGGDVQQVSYERKSFYFSGIC